MLEAEAADRHRHQLAQQRGHPCRHLLPAGFAEGAALRRGQRLLYDYCRERGVAHRRCGKLIVATTPEQMAELDAIHRPRRGPTASTTWCCFTARSSARAGAGTSMPAQRYFRPSTGIIDSHGLMLSLLGDAEANGAMLAFNSPRLLRGRIAGNGVELEIGGNAPSTTLRAHGDQ